MANKKVSQLTSKPSVLTTDLFPIADPSTGQLFKTTISDLGTAIGSGVSSVNSLVGAVVLDTDDIQELVSPTNKWFTDTRARAALSASSPLTYNSGTGAFGIQVANGSQNGYLSSADWNTFNNKIGTGGGTITGATTFTNTVTLGTASGDNQTLLNLPAGNQLIYREGVGSFYGFNIESGIDNSLFLTNNEGGYYQTLYFGDSTGAYNIFGISTSSNSGSTWNPRLVINQNGNVGLNKNNPTEILDVSGNGLFSGNLTSNYLIGVAGGSFSGDVTITGTNPRLYFTDTDNNPDYFISNTDGTFTIYDVTNSTSRLTISTLNTTLNTNLRIDGDVLIKQDSVFGGVSGYTGIGSDSSGIFLKLGTATSHAYLVLSGLTSYRNFTLPDATGTFALTSDLGSYLPLSGGTLTGALNGTSATFSSTITSSRNDAGNISLTLQNSYINQGNLINFKQNKAGSTINAYIGHGGDSTGNFIINNGTQAITITNSGSVGIGTTSPSEKLHVVGVGLLTTTTATAYVSSNTLTSGTSLRLLNDGVLNSAAATIRLDASGGDGSLAAATISCVWTGSASSDLTFGTRIGGSSVTERMRITSSGLVGIGTTSPSAKLQIEGTNDTYWGQLTLRTTNTATQNVGGIISFGGFHNGTSNASNWAAIKGAKENANANDNASYLNFQTQLSGGSLTERMRITSGGKLLVNRTATIFSDSGHTIQGEVSSGGTPVLEVYNQSLSNPSPAIACFKNSITTNSDARFIQFYADAGTVAMGGIVGNGTSNVQFASISDIRKKQNINKLDNSLNKIMGLNPVSFNWISNNEFVPAGFIAQEVEQVFPEYVVQNMEEINGVTYKGLTGGMTGGIVPVLVKAIQELKAELDTLKNK